MSSKNKLEEVFGKIQQSKWNEAAQIRKQNQHWLHYSQEVALAILEKMDQKGITQKALAEAMNVSPQLINKWVKGNENFTLETISKLEAVLGIRLLKIGMYSYKTFIPVEFLPRFTEEYKRPALNTESINSFRTAKVIKLPQAEYSKTAN